MTNEFSHFINKCNLVNKKKTNVIFDQLIFTYNMDLIQFHIVFLFIVIELG